ncbi:hypothetical protein ACPOL_0214 [Acidisarcina polymorpha]|uniref:Uncharacterized protein n=1 Tax=Acidisarcina polymorpha TaxID=2211140 RepID=A0A2Z5FS63_9BACT|nr:hypothetical protein [Acidisarcina polymorpha]AXC09599.1 hypothetical protein ACPOL_0214 [Acidisarcina polymorpha]
MKLRIHGKSLRLRISRSELTRFVETGLLEETIYFGVNASAGLTYALAWDDSSLEVGVEAAPGRVKIVLPAVDSRIWASTDRVGLGGEVDLGVRGVLSVLVEKDFACLDRNEEENADTFPNPLAAHVC